MQVSCKVSYSVIVHVERQGVQTEAFFENFETPIELLKDPTCSLPDNKMEEFLSAMAVYVSHPKPEIFYREIGQKNFELRAWGVLDSVLKMVETPKDIFTQPDRFLSYFLSPHPEVEIIKQDDKAVTFQLMTQPQTPLVLAYLMGAVEGLPRYMGSQQAIIQELDDSVYQIGWNDNQQSLFGAQEKKRRQFHPEIVHSVMQSLQEQNSQSGIQPGHDSPEQIASEAFERMVALEVEKRMGRWLEQQEQFDAALFKIKNDFYKMYDYFTRAQQIITLISPTARKASVREAMRRVDWEYVQKEFSTTVENACDSILAMKDTFQPIEEQINLEEKQAVNLSELIDNLVEDLSIGDRSLSVEKQWNFDRDISVEKESFSRALVEVLNNSVEHIGREGELKIATRLNGGKVQIEITDNSSGISSESLQNIFKSESASSLSSTQEVIERHKGNISISSQQGVGSRYLIELPI